MENSVVESDLGGPPESWEVADVDASMRRLMLSSSKKESNNSSSSSKNNQSEHGDAAAAAAAESTAALGNLGVGTSDDLVNSVDQFLREALQNPRERLSVLRMEQDVEKFIRDPTRQQMEFQQLPTSYLRLAAHRVAQHYSLQSMVLLDNSLPDGSGSRIIVRKTSECRMPLIRLADIPVNLPSEGSGVLKVAIKQRPQKGLNTASTSNSHSSKSNSLKSVEERKEEYNRARARIFNSNSFMGGISARSESESRTHEGFQHVSRGALKAEEKPAPCGGPDLNGGRGLIDSASGRSARPRTEREPVSRAKTTSRVAIFRDREIDRKDPDYDRSYDRYMQRFDPGFGFNGGAYAIQPMYAPAINYNTEFPQLGSTHRPPMSADHQARPLPQHLPGPWTAPSTPVGMGYGPPDTMLTPYNHGHVGAHSNSALYLHSPQYPCQRPGVPFIHPHEQIHQSFTQSHQQQPDATFGLARPR